MKKVKRIHVISRKNSWIVKKEDSKRAIKIHQTKISAIHHTYQLSKKGYDIIIHKKDGTVQEWKIFEKG